MINFRTNILVISLLLLLAIRCLSEEMETPTIVSLHWVEYFFFFLLPLEPVT